MRGFFFTMTPIDIIISIGLLAFAVLGFRRGTGEWSSVLILAISWGGSLVGWYRFLLPLMPVYASSYLLGLVYLALVSLLVLVLGFLHGIVRQLISREKTGGSFSGAIAGMVRLLVLLLIFATVDNGVMRDHSLGNIMGASRIMNPAHYMVMQLDDWLRPQADPEAPQ